jgi:hypothetical protein
VVATVGHQDKQVGFGLRCVVGSRKTEVGGGHRCRLSVSVVLGRLRDGQVDDSDEGFRSEAQTRHPGRLWTATAQGS